MKSEQEFLQGVYRKAEALRRQEVSTHGKPSRQIGWLRPALVAAVVLVLAGLGVGGMYWGGVPAAPATVSQDGNQRGAQPAAFGIDGQDVSTTEAERRLFEQVLTADAIVGATLEPDASIQQRGVCITLTRVFMDAQGCLLDVDSLELDDLPAGARQALEQEECVLFLTRQADGFYELAAGGEEIFLLAQDGSYSNGSLRFTQEQLEAMVGHPVSNK